MRNYVVLAIALILVGCATPVERVASTPSGSPEVTINADIQSVRNAVINRVLSYDGGYSLISQTDNLLEFERTLTGTGESMVAALSVGNSYSNNTRVLRINLINSGNNQVRVIAKNYMKAVMVGGQVNMEPLESNNVFNLYYNDFQKLKQELELAN